MVFVMKGKRPKKIWELLLSGSLTSKALRIGFSIPMGKLSAQQELGSIPAHATTSQQEPSGPLPFICSWRNP